MDRISLGLEASFMDNIGQSCSHKNGKITVLTPVLCTILGNLAPTVEDLFTPSA